MPVIQGRTWEQLRVMIGYQLMGSEFFVSKTTSSADATSVIDTSYHGVADDANGKWIVATSGDNDGEVRRVTDDNGSGDMTTDAFGATVPTNMTYELWEERFNPAMILEIANQAVLDATGRVYDPGEDISLHGDCITARFDIPTTLSMISRVDYRSYVRDKEIHDCESVFDETTDGDFTQVNDDQDKKRGGNSLKMTVAVGADPGDFVTDATAETLDLSKYTYLEGWVKSTVALSADDYMIRLDNGVVQGDTSDLEILGVSAALEDTWTFFRVELDNPETDTAIISIGIEMNVDKGAHVIRFDDIRAVTNDSAIWTTLGNQSWRIDQEARDLVITAGGVFAVGNRLIKLVGGDKPAVFATDASVNEIDDSYVIAYVMAHTLAATNDSRAPVWFARLQQTESSFPFLVDVREIS